MDVVLRAKISPTSLKLTALTLAWWCNAEGGSLHPSMQTIAGRVGVSRAQAQRLVHTLIDMGLLSVLANANGGRPGTTPRYQLHLDRFALLETGSTDATGRMDATGSADAQEGSHGCTEGVAPMHETGHTGEAQAVKNSQRTVKETERAQRNARTCRITDDWQPDEKLRAWAHAKRPDLDLPAVIEVFRDHYLAKGEARASWDASFRTWVNRERAANPATGRHSGFASKNYREGVEADGTFN